MADPVAVDTHAIWERVKANNSALNGCPKHKFVCLEAIRFGGRVQCENCGGTMQQVDARQYVLGYKAGGGDPNDVWPGWN